MSAQSSRRNAIRLLSGAVLAAGCPALKAQSGTGRRLTDPPAVAADRRDWAFPMVDFHAHVQRNIAAEDIVAHMDSEGVSRTVLMPLYYGDRGGAVNDGEGSDEQALDYARRFPGRFVPFVGMQRPELNDYSPWRGDTEFAQRILGDTEAKLASGEFFGMGEIMLRFYPYTNRFGVRAVSDMNYPADSPLMHRFAELSAKYRAPMVVHAEAEPEVAEAMSRLLQAHPRAIVVWSHNCGRMSADGIADFFRRFPNLRADLGGMVYSGAGVEHYGVYYPRRTRWMHLLVDDHGTVLPDMKRVIEANPDRYVIGADIAHARVWVNYGRHWGRWRRFFNQLPPAIAQAISSGNAERLFRGVPA